MHSVVASGLTCGVSRVIAVWSSLKRLWLKKRLQLCLLCLHTSCASAPASCHHVYITATCCHLILPAVPFSEPFWTTACFFIICPCGGGGFSSLWTYPRICRWACQPLSSSIRHWTKADPPADTAGGSRYAVPCVPLSPLSHGGPVTNRPLVNENIRGYPSLICTPLVLPTDQSITCLAKLLAVVIMDKNRWKTLNLLIVLKEKSRKCPQCLSFPSRCLLYIIYFVLPTRSHSF